MKSQKIEKKVEGFLKTFLKPYNPSNKRILQKKKFILLSKLIADLFKSKNSKICFNNISNLIILILNIYNEKFPVDIYSYQKENSRKTVSSKTLNCYKDSIAVFLRFLKKDIPVPKRAKTFQKLPKYFTLNFLEKSIIPMVDLVSRNPVRDKVLLYFVYFTGLRKSELTKLKRENFNLEERIVKVIIQKTKEERIVFYTKRVKDLLEAYFSLEAEDTNAFNLCSSTLETLLKNLNPYFKEIHLHTHLLRHSFSAHFLMQGGDISDLKEFLGHKSIQSTMRYAGLKT
ncbi:hypothetical protein LCGC14_2664890, partial [marine sediment metagenome]